MSLDSELNRYSTPWTIQWKQTVCLLKQPEDTGYETNS